ncbi:MAG TPA: hypothetical protein VLM75_08765 [Spirochaetota bacterium]|nr:hypothetical protein [Spirochaetota bacterium]
MIANNLKEGPPAGVRPVGDIIDAVSAEFLHLRDNAKNILGVTREFLIRAALRLRDFRSVVFPHIKYFYAIGEEGEEDTFIRKVVNTQKREMESVIARSLEILRGNESISDNVMAGIERSFEIPRRVEEIIDIIEAIEIHSVNTMIISKKTGAEGEALARISYEMGNLSRDANEISTRFAGLIKDLNDAFSDFGAARSEQAGAYEKYLSRFGAESGSVFNRIAGGLEKAAGDVIQMVASMDGVDDSIRGVIDHLSMEDVLRQDIEKIIYLTEEMASGYDRYLRAARESAGSARLTNMALVMIREKIGSITRHLDLIMEQAAAGFSGIRKIIEGADYGGEGDSLTIPQSLKGMDDIYDSMEKTRKRYIDEIEKIIGGRRGLYDQAGRVLSIVFGFGLFFDQIGAVARRFEIITMITRIELARHHRLRSALEGTLSEVSSLPKEIKRIVDGLNSLHGGIMEAMQADMEKYRESFDMEERRLREGIESIARVAASVAESRSNYRKVLEQIGEKSGHFIEFIGQQEERSALLRITRRTLGDIVRDVRELLRDPSSGFEEDRAVFGGDTEWIKRSVADAGEEGDYKRMMLLSFLDEMREGAEREEGSTIFF